MRRIQKGYCRRGSNRPILLKNSSVSVRVALGLERT